MTGDLAVVVEVRLFATFRQGRFKEKEMSLSDSSRLADLLDHLKIPHEEAHIRLVNGVAAPLDRLLADKDVIAIFPPMGGG